MYHVGPIPAGDMVLHKCDNPPCVNPDHLFLGNALINRRDCLAKGRTARGELSGKTRLTEAEVLSIRQMYSAGVGTDEIAKAFNICATSSSFIATGRSWKHLKDGICPKRGRSWAPARLVLNRKRQPQLFAGGALNQP